MPNIIKVDDSFNTLAADATLHFRVPEVQFGTSVWTVEAAASNVVGGGSGDLKFNVHGAIAKINSGVRDCAVQVSFITVNDTESYSFTIRDQQPTPYQRHGYLVTVTVRPTQATGLFSVGYLINYVLTYINQNIAWTFLPGENVVSLEAIGNNFRVIINGVVALSFSNSAVPFAADATRCGIICHNRGNGDGRIKRFTVFDSIELSTIAAYPIIRFG